ncbi:unnamed protein product [Rotaria socialis]|uniref:Sacsin/Nov domain-containing protein n=1 Tax=Rotaria socialis TaxID=392032 RepID=A0A818J801_9BILA|nr:unnamed protein product [Rotaria socialis]
MGEFTLLDHLRSMAQQNGNEQRVQVNQRLLIDKMLARYSSDFVVFRELIQNSDDAKATSFHFEITCEPLRPLVTSAKTKITLPSKELAAQNESLLMSNTVLKFHNSRITQLRMVNNGIVFDETDWKRVASIAEGNTNVESVGQFGVGFFTVFSYCDEPIITSGNEYMAFVWRDDISLTTYRCQLPIEQQSNQTSIILKMKTEYILITEANTDSSESRVKLAKNTTKGTTEKETVPSIDFNQLKTYCAKVLSFTKYINEISVKINGDMVFNVKKTKVLIPSAQGKAQFKKQSSVHSILNLNRFEESEQTFSITNGPSLTLRHIAVDAAVTINEKLHSQIQHTMKKRLPSNIQIQILYASNDLIASRRSQTPPIDTDPNAEILNSLIPLKFENGRVTPSGLIFVGLGTHQTTGFGMHAFSHLIPTIERENIDLQDAYISIWNTELLMSIGQIARLIYDRTMLTDFNKSQKLIDDYEISLISYSFQSSVPDGKAIIEGFFVLKNDVFLPTQQKPSDKCLTLVPSTTAFLARSKRIHKFLSLPLIPFQLVDSSFIRTLEKWALINIADRSIIEKKLLSSILSKDELIELIQWLFSEDVADKLYAKRILLIISFNDPCSHCNIKFGTIQYYDALNTPSMLPLPSNTLPRDITAVFSKDQLENQLSLIPLKLIDLVNSYCKGDMSRLISDPKLNPYFLSFVSTCLSQINKQQLTQIKQLLSKCVCIPTTKGMKIPRESFIPSELTSPELPVVLLNIIQTDTDNNEQLSQDLENPVTLAFLKQIGCRMFNIHALDDNRVGSDRFPDLKKLIRLLIKERDNMIEEDFSELKVKKIFRGTTLEGTEETKQLYIPSELHFPSVAATLGWCTLPIIDWLDINPQSSEYAFLKEIGVQEMPDLQKVLERITQEHTEKQQKQTSNAQYEISLTLKFFAEKFKQYYLKSWKKDSHGEYPFLPSYSPGKTIDECNKNNVILCAAKHVFTAVNPLFPSLLPEVVKLFQRHFDILSLGIEGRPTLKQAFNAMMERKNDLLTEQSASRIFAYLNTIELPNEAFKREISQFCFIPLHDNSNGTKLVKPSEVFIRANVTSSKATIANVDNFVSRGLIDYVDFGVDANAFLKNMGVCNYPRPSDLAGLLIQRQAAYFANINSNQDLLNKKCLFYMDCLRRLAYYVDGSNELNFEPLNTRLRTNAWCLGYQTVVDANGTNEKILKIVKPNEIYLEDNSVYSMQLHPLLPPNKELEKLYEHFGARWLSKCVKESPKILGKSFPSERATKLKKHIQERFPMLFVNNRGEPLPNRDEKNWELLRKTLSVYEVDAIKVSLVFEDKVHPLNQEYSSSCHMECNNKEVILYIRKDATSLRYRDIANKLATFVLKKPEEHVQNIRDKLELSIEELKREGIPVERLLENTPDIPKLDRMTELVKEHPVEPVIQHPIGPVMQHPVGPLIEQPSTPVVEKKPGFVQMILGFLFGRGRNNHVHPVNSTPLNTNTKMSMEDENTESTPTTNLDNANKSTEQNNRIPSITGVGGDSIEYDYSIKAPPNMPNFKTKVGAVEAQLPEILKGQSYKHPQLTQLAHTETKISTSCEEIPAIKMIRTKHIFHSIPLYIEDGVKLTDRMLDHAKQLSHLLRCLATHVFKADVKNLHIFRDIKTDRIAFNFGGAIFFNLRYFEQVYADELEPLLQQLSSSKPMIHTIVNFYFMVYCHELSHNIAKGHDEAFVQCIERVAVRFMTDKDMLLEHFSFKDSMKNLN